MNSLVIRRFLCCVFSLTASAFVVTVAEGVTPVVDLNYARYRGYFDSTTNVSSFLGIRYAAPPVGKLRFQPPQPPVPMPGVQPAINNPDMCYQAPNGNSSTGLAHPYGNNKRRSTMTNPSEDCLYLNVFVPGSVPTAQGPMGGLPVLVWFHGGGYRSGYIAEYNGADLVVDSLNTMVVVVVQYRLGAFGFLSGDEIKTRGTLNAGLHDQTFALRWIQDHIGSFSGNRNHVTIWGQSAGGGSVLQHIVANGGNTQPPLFSGAIVSSLYLPPQYHYNDRVPRMLCNDVVSKTGCESSTDRFACLQSVDGRTLQIANADTDVLALYGTSAWVPVIDGTFIIDRPTEVLSRGRLNGQVLLAVNNQNEAELLVNGNQTSTTTAYTSHLFPDMTPSAVREAARLYQDYGTVYEQAIKVLGEAIFICPTYYLLDAFAGRSWKGSFAIPPGHHMLDVPYYFSDFYAPPVYNNTDFKIAFSQSFMSLAKYYDVNVKFDQSNRTPDWATYVPGQTEMLFNRTASGAPVVMPIQTDPRLLERCGYWSTVTGMTSQ